MKTSRSIAFVITVLLLASLAACVRPIPGTSNEPAATSEAGSAPQAGATDVLGQIYLFATQTAMATQGLTTGVPSSLDTPVSSAEAPAIPIETVAPPTVQAVPPSQPIVIPTATAGKPASYTLAKGEFPYCIARRFNVNPGALLRANGLTSYSVYFAGMVLTIPQGSGGFPGNRALRPHPATYTVRPGDTVHSIACTFGDVDPNMIAFANNIGVNARLTPGEVLQIP